MTSVSSDTTQMNVMDDIQQNEKNIKKLNSITDSNNVDQSQPQQIIHDDISNSVKELEKAYNQHNTLYSKQQSLGDNMNKYYDNDFNKQYDTLNSIQGDIMNKSRIISVNNKAYHKKKQMSEILMSTIITILLLGITAVLGKLILLNSRTLVIIYLLIIGVYIFHILWITIYSKPRWNPYVIRKDDTLSDNGDSGDDGDNSSCTRPKPVHDSGCDTYSCSTFGCRDRTQPQPDDGPFPDDNGGGIGGLTDDNKALRVDSSLNNWLYGDTTGILSNPQPNALTSEYQSIDSGYKYELKKRDQPRPSYTELQNDVKPTTYTCQLSNGTKTPDIVKTSIPCKYFVNYEKQLS